MKLLRQHSFIFFWMVFTVLFLEQEDAWAQIPTTSQKEKMISLAIRIQAPLDSVWKRWTSEKELQKFFAPVCHLEPKVFGLFEIYFVPNAPAGQRGAENNRVLAIQEKKMFSFTWDAPPQYPDIRSQRTFVTVHFYPVTNSETLVTLVHTGWGQGDDWNTVFGHFEQAWAGFVLPNLKYSLEVKPVNWKDFPKNVPQGLKPAEKL
jgi:uncharacterized protein YndB with AHSA1/START domain